MLLPKNEIINVRRRSLLKAVPFIAATPYIIKSRLAKAALYSGSGSGPGFSLPSQPAVASSWGYNALTFWDDFLTTGTIDVNNTCQPGYNWYVQSTLPQSASNPGGYVGPTGSRLVGRTFKGGMYAEARLNFNPTKYFDWWMQDSQLWLNYADNNNTGVPLMEVDFIENFNAGSPAANYIQWNNNLAGTPATSGTYSVSDYTQFHKYGFLWVPASKNGGVGIFQTYLDGATQFTQVTYGASQSPTGLMSTPPVGYYTCTDSSSLGMDLIFGGVPGSVINVDYVMVWQ